MRFRREEIDSFHATDYDLDPGTGTLLLRYAFGADGTGDGRITFEERIDLGGPLRLDHHQERAFERVVRLIHATAGTSYYKAAAPGVVHIDSGRLTASERRFVEDLYDKGLREFAYRNNLPVPLRVEIQAKTADEDPALRSGGGGEVSGEVSAAPPSGVGIPIGGGKDSIVVVEALKEMKPLLVGINPAPASRRVAEVAGLELVSVRRTLDPLILELNNNGALNGHVPITAVISLIAVAAGYVHGYSTTVMALEGSADEATRLAGDTEVNHQWSKSTECEVELRQALAGIVPGIGYGSVLRGLSELEIGRCFAGLSQYHHVFRSCNRAFSLTGALDGWCNDCPKCRFVYLTLATSLGRDEMIGIFGADLLASVDQVDGFRDLFDTDRKPFECVGTRSESIAAFEELFTSPIWSGSVVVKEVSSLLAGGSGGSGSSGSGSGSSGSGSPSGSVTGDQVLQVVREAAHSLMDPARAVSAPAPAPAPA
jgi:UDP-N-acetyl-alpha-D-muramoyl-L-alanyl-L-glutamate epimerase